jgi:hypothetical protein
MGQAFAVSAPRAAAPKINLKGGGRVMKTIQMSVLMTCVLLLGGTVGAQTVAVQDTLDYQNNSWFSGSWFVEAGAILDHYPFYRGSNQDWGWTHDVRDAVPAGATGIESATVTIIAWKIDVEEGEDDVIYVLPEQPAITTSIWRIGTELGLLKSYLEAPVTVSWPSEGQIPDYANLWSITTFDLPADALDDLWANGQLYFHMDIDQINYEGMRATLKNSVLRINYFAPEPVAPPTVDVYRFWSPLTGTHFYTISEDEAQNLIANYASAWSYEGTAYCTLADDVDPSATPVHRFWSPLTGSHFYTASASEADNLITNWAHAWIYEGVAFYAYPEGLQPANTYPVYRFWSPLTGSHFFTMDESEAQNLLANYAWAWTFEGIAWYAFMP